MIKPQKPPFLSTHVDPDNTRAQIDRMLRDFGVQATQWTVRYDLNQVKLAFMIETEVEGVRKEIGIEIEPPLFVNVRRTWNSKLGRYEKVNAPNWAQSMRLLFWWLKAKLQAVAYGLTSVEREFLSQVIVSLPTGERITVGQAISKSVAEGQIALPSESKKDTPRIVELS